MLSDFSIGQNAHNLELSGDTEMLHFVLHFVAVLAVFCFCVGVIFAQDEDASGGDQDQEERRWNKRTQQMLHGLQVKS